MTPPERIAAESFRIAVSEPVLQDLRERLRRARWPNEAKAAPWRYGASLDFMRGVVEHWRERYDWRKWERELNKWPNYRALIEGKHVHFLLERGSGPNPLPLILTHGWPGSIVEFLHVIEP